MGDLTLVTMLVVGLLLPLAPIGLGQARRRARSDPQRRRVSLLGLVFLFLYAESMALETTVIGTALASHTEAVPQLAPTLRALAMVYAIAAQGVVGRVMWRLVVNARGLDEAARVRRCS